jgi:hypothetical protein
MATDEPGGVGARGDDPSFSGELIVRVVGGEWEIKAIGEELTNFGEVTEDGE